MTTEFVVLVDGKLDTLTPESAAQQLAPELEKLGYTVKKPDATTDPIKVPPVETIVEPSVQRMDFVFVGTQKTTGNPMYLVQFPDQVRLLEDHSGGQRVKFSVCGFEIGINLVPGVKLPSGPWTQNWGFNTPADFVCPADYTAGNFPAQPGQTGRSYFVWKYYQEPAQADAGNDVILTILGHYALSGR
jgi:hypothetical protein